MSSLNICQLAFEPGQQVECVTRYDDTYTGEVIAFDLNSKILIIKSPASSGNSANRDLHIFKLENVKDVKSLEEPRAGTAKDLPNMEMKHIITRKENALQERLRLVEAVGNGVSQDGISLFLSLEKKYSRSSDLFWKDEVKIVVMNSVVIKPPYKESDCELLKSDSSESNRQSQSLTYVKNIVKKFWENS